VPKPLRHIIPATAVLFVALLFLGLRGLGAPPTPVHGAMGRGPTIVLVHGLGSRIQDWLPAARRLAAHHRVALVELPGHGDSGMPEPFSLERATEALDQALATESSEPVVLVGHSIGGLIATAEALAHPKRVRKLVLVETLLAPQVRGPEREALLHALDTDYRDLLRREYVSFGRDSAQGLELYREVAAQDSANMKRWIRLALTADLSARVAALAMPVLAVVTDRTWPPSEPWSVTAAAIGYRAIPDCRPVRISNSGHFIMLDHPGPLAELIARFADRGGPEPVAAR